MPDWVTIHDLKNDQTLDDRVSGRDDEALQRVLDAAMVWVESHRPDLSYQGAWTVPADVRLGTIRLAARWFVRRISPDGTIHLGDLGTGTINATWVTADPDIQMQLGIVGGLA